ncbi:GlpG protein [Marinospirillum alkaliphilum DSM 21637]|uniref:GlpG protein n=2 Tax=Marinospirillum TaxID=64968 RepID=A0A1K1VGJ4_9GAMM|nr:GlpG protein [Marinospirillum alkaliphilum DSM 21637]
MGVETDMIKLLVMGADQDPMPLSRHLWRAGVAHRILPDEQGQQVFWLLNPEHLPRFEQAMLQWQSGQMDAPVIRDRQALVLRMQQVPVTLVLMLLAVAITLAFEWLWGAQVFLWVSFTPMEIQAGQVISLPISETLASGQWWRLITPIFIHFGWMHLVFNLLWTWVFGERIETQQGSLRLVLLVVFAALVSNSAQFLFNGSSQFGGLSGVVYAYLGYIWLWNQRHPQQAMELPNALVIFMLGWMLLGMTDISRSMGLNMANEAHLGGLLAGLAFALLPRFSKRNKR